MLLHYGLQSVGCAPSPTLLQLQRQVCSLQMHVQVVGNETSLLLFFMFYTQQTNCDGLLVVDGSRFADAPEPCTACITAVSKWEH